MCEVGPWLTDNVFDENNLYNVVLIMLGQHCRGMFLVNVVQIRHRQHCTKRLLVQCWPRVYRHVFAGK